MLRLKSHLVLWLCGLLTALVAAPIGTAEETPMCVYCKQPIVAGEWFNIEGKAYHWKHFLCANCEQPIGEQKYFAREGRYYDSACFMSLFAQRCDYCRQPIESTYVTIDQKSYHRHCYLQNVADRCALCGQPIEGPYLHDSYGSKVHADHLDDARQCSYCSRLISAESNGGQEYSDGRVVCGFCLTSVVRTQREADSLLHVARQILARQGITFQVRKLPLELVSGEKMRSLGQTESREMSGFTKVEQTTVLGGLIKSSDVRIYILDRMPRINFIATAAHELMHVWLGLHGRFETHDLLAEGSCNYASYLTLQHYPDEATHVIDHMLGDEDPIYGEGFRKVKQYAERVGMTAWLDYLKRENLPPWEAR